MLKKSLLSVLSLVFVSFCAYAQHPEPPKQPTSSETKANPNAPEITFEASTHDFGTLKKGDECSYEFKFTNTGKEPLIIYSATGSCGCTVPTAPKEPIKGGETGVIKVHYDTKRVGNFEKTVTVSSNGKTPNKTLRIKGVVKAAPAPAESNSVTPH